ncbi:MAG: TIGR00730 family Rossman fold protein [Pseudomonadota bacterium]
MSARLFCVFCGSRAGTDSAFAAAAQQLGRALVEHDLGLVYGGARIGLMGIVADAVLAAGGPVVGVIPKAIADIEIAHEGLTELHQVGSMHERKALMAARASGFIALPGGLGTLEELFEVWTWAQLAIHHDPLGVLNTNGFYDPLLAFVDSQLEQGFVRAEHRALLSVAGEPGELIDRMLARPTPVHQLRDKLEP